jgi:hypothetical protein
MRSRNREWVSRGRFALHERVPIVRAALSQTFLSNGRKARYAHGWSRATRLCERSDSLRYHQTLIGVRSLPFRRRPMISSKISDHFLAIWLRVLNQPSLDTLSPELISTWATARGLTGAVAEERDVGAFGKTKSIVLTVGTDKGCFPKIKC